MRHVPSEMKKGVAGETRAQIPYNVEVGSAVYTFSFNLDLDGVSRVSTRFGKISENEKKLEEQRPVRLTIALRALVVLLSSLGYGAKRTRFLPNVEPLSAVAAYSNDSVFVVSPGNYLTFIKNTLKRAKDYQNAVSKLNKKTNIEIICFDREGATQGLDVKSRDTLESLANAIIDLVLRAKS